MQFGRFHGVARITLGVMPLGLQTMLYMTIKQVVTGPPEFSTTRLEHETYPVQEPWHSVFDGRCSHPRYAAARRGTRGKKCRQVWGQLLPLLASFLGVNGVDALNPARRILRQVASWCG